MGGWGTAIMGSYLGQGIKGYNDAELQEEQLARSELQRQAAQEELAAAQETRPLKMQQEQLGLDLAKEKFQSWKDIDKPEAQRKAYESEYNHDLNKLFRNYLYTGDLSYAGEMANKYLGLQGARVQELVDESGKPYILFEADGGRIKKRFESPDEFFINVTRFNDVSAAKSFWDARDKRQQELGEYVAKKNYDFKLDEMKTTSSMKDINYEAKVLGVDPEILVLLKHEKDTTGEITDNTMFKEVAKIEQAVDNDPLVAPDKKQPEKDKRIQGLYRWREKLQSGKSRTAGGLGSLGSGSAAPGSQPGAVGYDQRTRNTSDTISSRGAYSASAPPAQQAQTGSATGDPTWDNLPESEKQQYIRWAKDGGASDPVGAAKISFHKGVAKKKPQQPQQGQGVSTGTLDNKSGVVRYDHRTQDTRGLGGLGAGTAHAATTAPPVAQAQQAPRGEQIRISEDIGALGGLGSEPNVPTRKVTVREAANFLYGLWEKATTPDKQKIAAFVEALKISPSNYDAMIDTGTVEEFLDGLSSVTLDVGIPGTRVAQ